MVTSNQKVLITGVGSGIGLALAKKFLSHNNTVIITGRNLAKLEKAKAALPNIHIFQSDVTNETNVRKLADNIQHEFGGMVRAAALIHYPPTPFIIFGILIELIPTALMLWFHTKLLNNGTL